MNRKTIMALSLLFLTSLNFVSVNALIYDDFHRKFQDYLKRMNHQNFILNCKEESNETRVCDVEGNDCVCYARNFAQKCKEESNDSRNCYVEEKTKCVCYPKVTNTIINPLRVLGLIAQASAEDIKRKCKDLLKIYHSDKGGSDDLARKLLAACEDLDWHNKDRCKTEHLREGSKPCACPITKTKSYCSKGFTDSSTRCECELSTTDDTPLPEKATYSEAKKQQTPVFEQQKTAGSKQDNNNNPKQQQSGSSNRGQDAHEQDFVDQKNSASGLISEILKPAPYGAQKPHLGQKVLINYVIWIQNADKSKGRSIADTYSPIESPVRTIVGQDPVVGLNEALLTMSVGQKSRFILSPHLVQGYTTSRLVTPATTLIYEIELVKIL